MLVFVSSLLIESRLAENRRCVWGAIGAHMTWNFMFNMLGTRQVPTSPQHMMAGILREKIVMSCLHCTELFVSWLVVSTLLEALWTMLGGKGGYDAPLYALVEDNEDD